MKNKNNYLYCLERVGYTLLCFCTSLIVIPIYTLLFGVAYLVRKTIDLGLRSYYKGRFQLLDPPDALCTVDFSKCASRYLFCGLIRTTLTPSKLEALQTKIGQHVTSGAYKKMQYKLTTKFGFPCWEDTAESFDIREHVKLCPEADDWNQPISENEMMNIITSNLNSLVANVSRPDWEILFVPRVRMKGGASNGNYVAMLFFLNHGYMDAMCGIRFLQTTLIDEDGFGSLSMATMNTLSTKSPDNNLSSKAFQYLKTILYGPVIILSLIIINNRETVFHESGGEWTSFMGRSKIKLSSSSMNRIRMRLNCQTKSVVTFAFLTALQRVAEKKDLPIPDALNMAFTHAMLPYPPDLVAGNSFSGLIKRLPLLTGGIIDKRHQLSEIDKLIQINGDSDHEMYTVWYTCMLVCYLPSWMIRVLRKHAVAFTLGATHVPGSERLFKVQNGELDTVFSIPPMVDKTPYITTFGNYGGRLNISFRVGRTRVIQSQHDFNIFINEFDNCLKDLERETSLIQK